ncbi:MAG: hypothetical protein ACR2P9_07980 [Gammaproteobacteria bacterium]
MSESWANRQRVTNQLARKIAKYLFRKGDISPVNLHGLSRLSWITTSDSGENAGYIRSTKIPALADVFDRDYHSNISLEEVSEDIASILRDDSMIELVQKHTGFTNFYGSYRNSSREWVNTNFDSLLPLYKAAYDADSNKKRANLIEGISKISGIPKANHPDQLMKPEYFLTPTFFMLDREVKFPIINGREWVQELLKAFNVHGNGLLEQYRAMVRLYGKSGINDAADLDQVREDASDFIDTSERKAGKKLLKSGNIENSSQLSLKDETDIEIIQKAGTRTQRRIHNQLTNKLCECLSDYTLSEGNRETCMFDVLVKEYDSESEYDLLIEVKSSSERPHIRMAVGQLYDYYHEINGDIDNPHMAILLPEKPDASCISFLKEIDIGLMWFDDDELCTSTEWLEPLPLAIIRE